MEWWSKVRWPIEWFKFLYAGYQNNKTYEENLMEHEEKESTIRDGELNISLSTTDRTLRQKKVSKGREWENKTPQPVGSCSVTVSHMPSKGPEAVKASNKMENCCHSGLWSQENLRRNQCRKVTGNFPSTCLCPCGWLKWSEKHTKLNENKRHEIYEESYS